MNNFSEILKKPKSKVLILRPEGSLGDAILSSGYYQSLKQFNKNIEIHLFCFHSAYEYAKNLKEVDHIYRIFMRKLRQHRGFISFLFLGLFLRLKKMDLIIDDNPYKGKNWDMFVWLLGKDKVLRPNSLYPSVSERTKSVLAELGVPYISPKLEILPQNKNKVKQFLTLNKIDKFIVFNTFGSVADRSFTPLTFKKMFKEIRKRNKDINVIFPFQPFQQDILKNFYIEDKNLFFFETSSPQDVFALIDEAGNILLVSPDTSFVHIATILKKPTIDVLNTNSYKTFSSLATEITTETNVNGFDIKLFAEALKKYL